MSPEAQRIAIAEACGFLNCQYEPDLDEVWGDSDLGWERVPDYLSDLNAMHEAEKVLSPKQWNQYVVNLARVIAEAKSGEKVQVPTNVLISATAAQRAEAFLRTLGLWKE